MKKDRRPQISRRLFVKGASAALAISASPVAAIASEDVGAVQGLRIWFIRHAQSDINVPGAPRPVPDAGMSYPLTLKGVEQAKALAESLAEAPLLAIHTSTHLRALQTADAIAFRRGMTVSLAPETVEIDLGVTEEDDAGAVYMDLAQRWTIGKDIDARHRDGESFSDVQRRFLPFVRELMNRHALDDGVIVIVAHSATLGLLTPVLATNIPADFALRNPLPHAGVIKTELRDSNLHCTEWAGISSAAF